jgi:uncharacterized protein YecE (DUF72 family)
MSPYCIQDCGEKQVLQSRVVTGNLFDTSDPESDAFRSRLTESLARLALDRIRVGGSSWKYEGWLGQIYTRSNYLHRGRFSKKAFEAECLREYCEIFPTVCGDFAFYQFPGESFWQKLFAQTPAGFQFAFKVPEQITCKVFPPHPRYGAQGGLANPSFLDFFLLQEAFLRPLEAHQEKVAVLIFEFGAFPEGSFSDVREFVELLDPFLAALPRHFRYAVEIRNEEFLGPEYFDCLRGHGVAHVFNAWARMPELKDQLAMPGSFTADFVVSRALLRRGRPYAQAVQLFAPYTKIQDPNPEARAGLRELIERAREARRAAYIYVNNRLEGNSPGTISAVIDPLG